jgi:hypothetical protein
VICLPSSPGMTVPDAVLAGSHKSFNGYDLEHAVRLLISIGSMDALDYLVTRPEMIKYRDDLLFRLDVPVLFPEMG